MMTWWKSRLPHCWRNARHISCSDGMLRTLKLVGQNCGEVVDQRTDDEVGRDLHERLVAGHPAGLEQAFGLYHSSVVRRLSSRREFRLTDPQFLDDGVLDAIIELVAQPGGYNPALSRTLLRHLEMAAERNVRNLLRSVRRRRERERKAAKSAVELASPVGNALQADQDRRQAHDRDDALALLPDPTDRAVLDLMLRGERRTAAFAHVLGIAALPVPEQRRVVKRVKDRIRKVLERGLRGREDRPDER